MANSQEQRPPQFRPFLITPQVNHIKQLYARRPYATILTALTISGSLGYWTFRRSFRKTQSPKTLPANTQDPNRPCRYRLDTETSAKLTLPDGRQLGYAEYGLPTGKPIFTIHGLPGSRMEAAVNDEMFRNAGARLIAVDRPGIGWSSPHPDSTVLDHAKDIEHLAEHLRLPSYAVWGSSAGGPYALACAASMPREKLKAVAVVCGLGSTDMSTNWSLWLILHGFKFGYRFFPGLIRWAIRKDAGTRLDVDDETRLQLLQEQFHISEKTHPKDAEVLRRENIPDDLRLYARGCREIYARGPDGLMHAALPLTKDWGFRLEDIRKDLPIQLWYGSYDDRAPLAHGREIARRLGREEDLRITDETHMSITANWKDKVLDDLLAAMRTD